MALRMFDRSYRVSTRLPLIPVTRCFSSVTHSYMSGPKPSSTSTSSVEPTLSASSMEEEFEASNSDADTTTTTTTTTTPQQQRDMNSMSMSMMDEQAKEKVDNMEKQDWTFEAESMSQDIHTTRGQKPTPFTDYL